MLFVCLIAFGLSGHSQIHKDQLALEISRVDADNTEKLKEYIWKLHADVLGEGGNKTTLICILPRIPGFLSILVSIQLSR